MPTTADVIVIGAGIFGMSTAFQIARRSRLRVLVLEKGSAPGEGSTGASSAVCRFRYSRPEMVELARDGIAAYRSWSEFLGSASPSAAFQPVGVVWAASEADWVGAEVERLTRLGVRVQSLDDVELRQRFPAIAPCKIAPDLQEATEHECEGGNHHLFEADGGYMDPMDALQDLIVAARGLGVELRYNCPVEAILSNAGSVSGVRLSSDEIVSSGSVVLAAGPWSQSLLDRCGLASRWPLVPTRIQMVHIDRPAQMKGNLPVCVDVAGGIYFRPQNRGQQIIVGSILEEDEQEAVACPDELARFADDEFIRSKLFALQHRLQLDELRGHITGYSGLYTINRADMHPVVGQTPIGGLSVACGCSGHGFKLAPAIGGLLAKAITGTAASFDTTMPAEFLTYDRSPIRLESKSVLA